MSAGYLISKESKHETYCSRILLEVLALFSVDAIKGRKVNGNRIYKRKTIKTGSWVSLLDSFSDFQSNNQK